MTAVRRLAAAAALLLLNALPAAAQDSGGVSRPAAGADRARLEQQLRQRVGRVVQARLRLTDEQMARLQRTNQSYEARRRALVTQERQMRLAIREQLAAGDSADQKRVAGLIESAIRIQRQRLDLVEQEQRELSAFLTPVQRARYLDLQERLRRRVEELRRGQERGRPGMGRGARGGRP